MKSLDNPLARADAVLRALPLDQTTWACPRIKLAHAQPEVSQSILGLALHSAERSHSAGLPGRIGCAIMALP
jgi:hypothetical protein